MYQGVTQTGTRTYSDFKVTKGWFQNGLGHINNDDKAELILFLSTSYAIYCLRIPDKGHQSAI